MCRAYQHEVGLTVCPSIQSIDFDRLDDSLQILQMKFGLHWIEQPENHIFILKLTLHPDQTQLSRLNVGCPPR